MPVTLSAHPLPPTLPDSAFLCPPAPLQAPGAAGAASPAEGGAQEPGPAEQQTPAAAGADAAALRAGNDGRRAGKTPGNPAPHPGGCSPGCNNLGHHRTTEEPFWDLKHGWRMEVLWALSLLQLGKHLAAFAWQGVTGGGLFWTFSL